MKAAAGRGYTVADLQPRFIARHARDGTRFEWHIDSHGNASGHEEAAAAVIATGIAQKLFTAAPAEMIGTARSRDALSHR